MIVWPDNGFTEDNLEILKNECRNKFNDNPAIYFVLIQIMSTVEDLFEGQAMDQGLYDAFTGLVPIFKKVLEQQNLQSLDGLVSRFNEIYPL
ncbi:MAG: hypothetical protein U9Q84_04740 [Thermodesulfobacteriota bacterium]|nr:hypothetical protein [Thermodesulfobacteriota bacterium]